MRHPLIGHRTTILLFSLMSAHCGGFFENGEGQGGPGGHERGRRGDHAKASGADCDGGTTTQSPEDVGLFPDATIADAGSTDSGTADTGEVADTGVPACTISPDCPVGEQCADGVCAACPDGVCPCARDNDCPADQLCDHAAGICEPPFVGCDEIADELGCLARADCQAVYGGVDCRDANGGECTSQDPDCTCASFSFATCLER